MADLQNQNQRHLVPNLLNDPIVTDTNTIEVLRADKFLATRRTRLAGQASHRRDQPGSQTFVAQFAEELLRRRTQQDTVHQIPNSLAN